MFLLLPANLQCTKIVTGLYVNIKVYLESDILTEELCSFNSDTLAELYFTEAVPIHTPTYKV